MDQLGCKEFCCLLSSKMTHGIKRGQRKCINHCEAIHLLNTGHEGLWCRIKKWMWALCCEKVRGPELRHASQCSIEEEMEGKDVRGKEQKNPKLERVHPQPCIQNQEGDVRCADLRGGIYCIPEPKKCSAATVRDSNVFEYHLLETAGVGESALVLRFPTGWPL